MSKSAAGRVSPVIKAMNRPLTVLGAERRLFFVALIFGGAIFSLLHSLFGGIALFVVGVVIAIASVTTLEHINKREVSNGTRPVTVGLGKPHRANQY